MSRPGRLRNSNGPIRNGAETRLMEATERLLARTPLRDISVEDILAESGVSRRTFYAYFASKYGVIIRLAEDALSDVFENLAPLVTRNEDEHGPDAMRRVIVVGCDIWASHRDLFRAVIEHWQQVEDLRDVWLNMIERIAGAIAEEIDRERRAGAAPPGPDPLTLSVTLMWATAHVLHGSWLDELPGLRESSTNFVEPVAALWIGAVYGAVPPTA